MILFSEFTIYCVYLLAARSRTSHQDMAQISRETLKAKISGNVFAGSRHIYRPPSGRGLSKYPLHRMRLVARRVRVVLGAKIACERSW